VITAERILLGYDFYRRRHDDAPPAHIPALRAALVFARELARSEADQPAALLFAFAVQRHTFGPAWAFMAKSIAIQEAHALGWALALEDGDKLVRAYLWRMSVAPFEDVRAFVAARLRPL
jgi:hypothetical protein